MSARTATVNIFVDGKAMDKEQRSTVTSVTYTDPASGQADSLDIAVSGGGNKWITDWYPGEGKVVSATIVLSDWEQEGAQDITLDCGKFILDEPKFSGWPVSGTLSAVSTPANKGFSKTERTKTWENVTLKEIGKNIGINPDQIRITEGMLETVFGRNKRWNYKSYLFADKIMKQ